MTRKSSVDFTIDPRWDDALSIANSAWWVLDNARKHVIADADAARFLLNRMVEHCLNAEWLIHIEDLLKEAKRNTEAA